MEIKLQSLFFLTKRKLSQHSMVIQNKTEIEPASLGYPKTEIELRLSTTKRKLNRRPYRVAKTNWKQNRLPKVFQQQKTKIKTENYNSSPVPN